MKDWTREYRMKTQSVIVAITLIASAAVADKPTFEYVQQEFQKKARALLKDEHVSFKDIQLKLAQFAEETFGAHLEVMKEEAERRLRDLPTFPESKLAEYTFHKALSHVPLSSLTDDLTGTEAWFAFSKNPESMISNLCYAFRQKNLSSTEARRLTLFRAYFPDKLYRLGTDKISHLVCASLDDLFVVQVEITEVGAYMPIFSVQWMKRKEPKAADSTAHE
jgi:hypothetical protein